jgi:hypothetical protein
MVLPLNATAANFIVKLFSQTAISGLCPAAPRSHPRTIGWFGTTAVAMGGINQSLFLLGALFVGQGAIHGQASANRRSKRSLR